MILGGIEAGGTKFVCVVGTEEGEILVRKVFDTTTPEETLGAVIDFFEEYQLAALGIGSFGPVAINPDHPKYGSILETPKKGWEYTPILQILEKGLGCPVAIDTDVNVAALAEAEQGNARDIGSCLYLTVGTGIGGGFYNGDLLHGKLHPEMGHQLIPVAKDGFAGICPYHGNCLEGMASGPAIEARAGKKAQYLDERDPVWDQVAEAIAMGLVNYQMVLSPERIILGGGVMKQLHLFPKIQRRFYQLINGYLSLSKEELEEHIQPPGLGDQAGSLGTLLLAARVLESQ